MLRITNPATGELVAELEPTSIEGIGLMVHRARQAQRSWAAIPLEERARLVASAAPMMKERSAAIGELITREMGKPIAEAKGEANYAASGLEEACAEIVAALRPQLLEDERTTTTMLHAPLGVAVCITPWNFPVLMCSDTVVPALVAGNTVILKPSELSTLCALEWAKCLMAVLPPDVLQVAIGDEVQGKALVAAPIDLIAFTGSRSAGRHIMQAAAGGLKRLILELGGKDPLVVLPDADIDAAAAFAARNSFRNAGQVCVSTERIYVHDSIAPAFTKAVIERAQQLVVGDGMQAGTQVGPMVNARQKEHVLAQVSLAAATGARIECGGDGGGNFIKPVVLTGVTHEMPIMQEETFGPVACIMTYREVDEAVRLANDSPYGLGGAVFGRDEARAQEVAERLHIGMVGVNQGCGGASGSPWVGARQSGYGHHSGVSGHRQFAQVRVVSKPKPKPATSAH
jgi:succinate-semialdehyde dehydrogenase/glutarate-semialdehyde dehydrogenase